MYRGGDAIITSTTTKADMLKIENNSGKPLRAGKSYALHIEGLYTNIATNTNSSKIYMVINRYRIILAEYTFPFTNVLTEINSDFALGNISTEDINVESILCAFGSSSDSKGYSLQLHKMYFKEI